jgi:ribosomal protein S18 acetylase RimI-like enzyme
MRTKIRKATPADADALIALSRRTIRASYTSFLGEKGVDGFIESGACDQYIRDHIDRSTVICLDGEVVGYSVCEDGRIGLMMIDHAAHRQGLGTALLAHMERELFETFDAITVKSFEDNANANAFYVKNGWSEVRQFADEADGIRYVEFRKRCPAALQQ